MSGRLSRQFPWYDDIGGGGLAAVCLPRAAGVSMIAASSDNAIGRLPATSHNRAGKVDAAEWAIAVTVEEFERPQANCGSIQISRLLIDCAMQNQVR